MGIFDKFTGTLHPEDGVAQHSAAQVRAALLALNGPDVPFVVRQSTPKERADLVAEWRIPELRVTLKTRMRLAPEKHEVRALDERWEPSLENAQEKYSRGKGGATVYWVLGEAAGPRRAQPQGREAPF